MICVSVHYERARSRAAARSVLSAFVALFKFRLHNAVSASDVESAVGLASAVTAEVVVIAAIAFFAIGGIQNAVTTAWRDITAP